MADKTYARVDTGIVVEVVTLDATINISDVYHPTLVAQMFDVTGFDPPVEVGWIYDGNTFLPPPNPTPEESAADLKTYAGAKRFEVETAGIMFGGRPANTDRASQAMVTSAWTSVQNDPSATMDWKDRDGNWVTLSGPQVVQFHSSVTAHVELCFSTEADVSAQIDSGAITSNAQIDAVFEAIPHLPPVGSKDVKSTLTGREGMYL
jgi:hypothetical protein